SPGCPARARPPPRRAPSRSARGRRPPRCRARRRAAAPGGYRTGRPCGRLLQLARQGPAQPPRAHGPPGRRQVPSTPGGSPRGAGMGARGAVSTGRGARRHTHAAQAGGNRAGAAVLRLHRRARMAHRKSVFLSPLLLALAACDLSGSSPPGSSPPPELVEKGGLLNPSECLEKCEKECSDTFGEPQQCPERYAKKNDCELVYPDTTPICNYLDRGLNDHVQKVADRYMVRQPGVEKLADIDTLRFGLDLPGTYCEDNPHSVPCSDHSYSLDWWLDSVRLSVLGIPLFEATLEPDEQALLKASGGAKQAGIVGFDAQELRANEMWGLSFNEIRTLFADLVIDDQGKIAFDPDKIVLEAEQVSRLLEGIVGRSLAAKRKGCVNALYCDDVRDKVAYWSDDPDCDFGGCPPKSARLPSPWLEIRGAKEGTILQLDLDIDLENGTTDLGDCDGVGGGVGPDHCGTKYTEKGRMGVEIDFEFSCVESGNGKFSIHVAAADLRVEAEQGVASWYFPSKWEKGLADELDAGTLSVDLAKNLDACPAGPPVEVGDDGSLVINLSDTIECEEGAECLGHRVYTGGSGFALTAAPRRAVGAGLVPAVAPLLLAPPSGSDILAAMEAYHGKDIGDIPITDLHTNLMSKIDPDEKIPMATLDAAVPMVCAMVSHCDDNFEFKDVTIPPPFENVELLTDCDDPENDADSPACQVYLQMRAFTQQPEVLESCVGPVFDQLCLSDPDLDQCDPAYQEADKYDLAMSLWLLAVQTSHDECKEDARPIEELIPVPFIELDITNGRLNVTDGFSFVDLQEAENVAPGVREEFACRHRPAKE